MPKFLCTAAYSVSSPPRLFKKCVTSFRPVSGSRSMLFLAASSPSESMSSSKKYPMMPLICPLWYIGQRVMVPLWEALWERTQQGTLARIFPVQRISSSSFPEVPSSGTIRFTSPAAPSGFRPKYPYQYLLAPSRCPSLSFQKIADAMMAQGIAY